MNSHAIAVYSCQPRPLSQAAIDVAVINSFCRISISANRNGIDLQLYVANWPCWTNDARVLCISSGEEVVFSLLSVRPSASSITRKVIERFLWNLLGLWTAVMGRTISLLELIRPKMARGQVNVRINILSTRPGVPGRRHLRSADRSHLDFPPC